MSVIIFVRWGFTIVCPVCLRLTEDGRHVRFEALTWDGCRPRPPVGEVRFGGAGLGKTKDPLLIPYRLEAIARSRSVAGVETSFGLLKNARQKTSKRDYIQKVGVITGELLLAIAAAAVHSRQLLAGAKDTDDVIDPSPEWTSGQSVGVS